MMELLRKDIVCGLLASPGRPEQSYQERETRRAAPFDEMERSFPMLTCRFPLTRLVDNLTSHLGSRNPFSHAFNAETDELWLFDNTAYRSPRYPHQWTAEFVAAYFRRGSGRDIGKVVADLAEKLGFAKGSQEEATVRERLQPFVDAILPARTVEIAVGENERNRLKLGPSGRSGISSDLVKLHGDFKDGRWIVSHAIKDPTKKMATRFAEPKGWAIISGMPDILLPSFHPIILTD